MAHAGSGDGEPTEAAAEYLMTIRYMHGEGQPVIAARLAERMGVSAATVSEMVTRLVREGLLNVDAETRQLNPATPVAPPERPSGATLSRVAAHGGHRLGWTMPTRGPHLRKR